MRLLYVDDNRINTLLFEQSCRLAAGVEVESAGSGAEALELLERWTPDLLVIDLHLPDTDGYALLPALQARLPGRPRPAYLCTADDLDAVRQAALQAGFDGCWSKPVDPRALVGLLAGLDGNAAA